MPTTLRFPAAGRASRLSAAALVLAGALGALALLLPARARADAGGFSQVSRLEIAYVPGSPNLQARVLLASGLTLGFQAASEQDSHLLLGLAQVFSQKNTRLFV